jgi:hypothetical protein
VEARRQPHRLYPAREKSEERADAIMTREFCSSTRWYHNHIGIMAIVCLLLPVGLVLLGQSPLAVLPVVLFAGLGLWEVWRESTMALYRVTDEYLHISEGLCGSRCIPWRDIKAVKQERYDVVLVRWQWFASMTLALRRLPQSEREEFLRLVRSQVDAAYS